MQINQSPFPVNKLDLENSSVMIRLEQADTTKGKNVVIGDPGSENDAGLTPSRKIVMKKLPDGVETITATIRRLHDGEPWEEGRRIDFGSRRWKVKADRC
jgi:hypothetical protein